MRRTAIVVATTLLLAACGGGAKKHPQASTPVQSAPEVTTTITESTTTAPPQKTRSHSIGTATVTTSAPLRVAAGYTCNGKPLHALSAPGPVKVNPAVVKPGQSFTVTVTDRSAKVVDVSLTGVASTPIVAHGVAADEGMAAHLKMPKAVSCGNKLLEVEGDVSAEAYVGVGG